MKVHQLTWICNLHQLTRSQWKLTIDVKTSSIYWCTFSWSTSKLGYSRKKNRGDRRGWGHGVLKNMWKFQGSIKKEVKEKLLWNFHGFWFLIMEFLRGVIQFCSIYFQGWKLVFSGNSKGKVTNYLKSPGEGRGKFRKVYPQPPVW